MLEIVLPLLAALGVWAGVEVWLRSDAVLAFVDHHRPSFGQAGTRVHVEKQVWHLEALARRDNGRIAVIGSSSVVNGVDPGLVRTALPVENLGVTGMLAYELPLMHRVLLTPGTKVAIYLYNQFSFADSFHPDAVDIRWDTREMLALAPDSFTTAKGIAAALDRSVFEISWLLRFHGLLRHVADQWAHGTLAPLAHGYDYELDDPAPPAGRAREVQTALPESNWLRRAYLESTAKPDSLGYRGLNRFCRMARERGITVVFAPVPEPGFLEWGPYAQGARRDVVDARVQDIAGNCGAVFVPRERFAVIEADDGLFRDELHLHRSGREIYSRLLGDVLNGAIR